VEATLTEDVDILISFEETADQQKSGLLVLSPLLSYLEEKGYDKFRKEGILIEGWPVQFLPVADKLDAEALAQAQEVETLIPPSNGNVRTRILRPEHIVAIALRTGRPKDWIRIGQFIEERAVDIKKLCDVISRYELYNSWKSFCNRSNIVDPCDESMTDEKR
jgi:hypothetical protein